MVCAEHDGHTWNRDCLSGEVTERAQLSWNPGSLVFQNAWNYPRILCDVICEKVQAFKCCTEIPLRGCASVFLRGPGLNLEDRGLFCFLAESLDDRASSCECLCLLSGKSIAP